jgi:hypothetical protein
MSQFTYSWSFVPRLSDATSWSNRIFVGQVHRLSDIMSVIGEKLRPNQIRGMVHFKADHVKVRKMKDVSFLEMGDEVCCYFTCKLHLDAIFKYCDHLAIPPSSISTIAIFNLGYFIH